MIHEDNMACFSLSKGKGRLLTSKHIWLRSFYLKEQVDNGEIILQYVFTEEQSADLLTKTLASVKFNELMKHIVSELVD